MTLLLVRHGESREKLRFHGWTDIPLSREGQLTAIRASEHIRDAGLTFDEVHTSILRRAVHTGDTILDELNLVHIPVKKEWRLIERMAGALTGLVKKEAAETYGAAALREFRRSVTVPPPPLDHSSPNHPSASAFASLLKDVPKPFPDAESLNDVSNRLGAYIRSTLLPALRAGRSVLVVGHSNSLRALIRDLEGLNVEEAENLDVPYGIPRAYAADAIAAFVAANSGAIVDSGAATSPDTSKKGKGPSKGASSAFVSAASPPLRGRWLAEEAEVRDAVARVRAQTDVTTKLLRPTAHAVVPTTQPDGDAQPNLKDGSFVRIALGDDGAATATAPTAAPATTTTTTAAAGGGGGGRGGVMPGWLSALGPSAAPATPASPSTPTELAAAFARALSDASTAALQTGTTTLTTTAPGVSTSGGAASNGGFLSGWLAASAGTFGGGAWAPPTAPSGRDAQQGALGTLLNDDGGVAVYESLQDGSGRRVPSGMTTTPVPPTGAISSGAGAFGSGTAAGGASATPAVRGVTDVALGGGGWWAPQPLTSQSLAPSLSKLPPAALRDHVSSGRWSTASTGGVSGWGGMSAGSAMGPGSPAAAQPAASVTRGAGTVSPPSLLSPVQSNVSDAGSFVPSLSSVATGAGGAGAGVGSAGGGLGDSWSAPLTASSLAAPGAGGAPPAPFRSPPLSASALAMAAASGGASWPHVGVGAWVAAGAPGGPAVPLTMQPPGAFGGALWGRAGAQRPTPLGTIPPPPAPGVLSPTFATWVPPGAAAMVPPPPSPAEGMAPTSPQAR